MGLLSSKKNVTNVTELVETQNIAVEGIEEGAAVLAGVDAGDIAIIQTDQGAIDAAVDIVSQGLDTVDRGFDTVELGLARNIDLASRTVDAGLEQVDRVTGVLEANSRDFLGATERIAGEGFSLSRDALALSDDLAVQSLDVVQDTVGTFTDQVGTLVNDFSTFIAGQGTQLLNAIGVIQNRESGNTDARLEQITRFAIIGAGAIAVVSLAIPLLKR